MGLALLPAVADWSAPGVLTVAGLLLVAESGLIVGMVLPGTTLLIALGLWAGTDGGSLSGALVVAPVATVLGAHLGYLRGRMRAQRPLPGRLSPRLRELIIGRGPVPTAGVVACGHWTVAARLWLPRLVGRLRVPYRVFGPTVAVSGWLWASTLILLSHLLGQQAAERAGWAVLFAVLGSAAVVVFVLRARRRRGPSGTAPRDAPGWCSDVDAEVGSNPAGQVLVGEQAGHQSPDDVLPGHPGGADLLGGLPAPLGEPGVVSGRQIHAAPHRLGPGGFGRPPQLIGRAGLLRGEGLVPPGNAAVVGRDLFDAVGHLAELLVVQLRKLPPVGVAGPAHAAACSRGHTSRELE